MSEKSKNDYEFADTTFVRDIESRVFQAIAFKCLMSIDGVELIGGNILDSLLGRDTTEKIKGVHIEQDQKSQAVNVRLEVNVSYGISIPEKAEEIQTKIAKEISRLTGLHVSSVHVIFKNLIPQNPVENILDKSAMPEKEESVELTTSSEMAEISDDL